jgi:DNA helicase II / ATP-dependent DNA helicase PcrA
MEYLSALNQAQKKAALTIDGPVLVLAGAGAGKTSTIAHRIVHLVKSGVPAYQILAITFTNKAAREMRERVTNLLTTHNAPRTAPPTVATFHALSAILLRKYAEAAHLSPRFTIYDRADSLRAVRRAIRECNEDEKRFEPRSVLGVISRAKGDAKTVVEYRELLGHAWYQVTIAKIWEQYDAILRKEGAIDFDDLLLRTYTLLNKNPTIRADLNAQYRYVHIDEYQDTNAVQYKIVQLLTLDHRNIFCVGDLDQNVYSWRGSTIENILEFEKEYPEATTIKLEQNYRSTQTIVDASNEVIKKNKRRKEKTLFTENPAGEKISLIVGYDERDEAAKVAEMVAERIQNGVVANEIAILYRANFQSRALEDAFLGAGIPYKVLGTRFFDRAEVKDTLAYIRAALNDTSHEDIRRIINTPARGIGKVTVDRLFATGREGLVGATREKVESFFRILTGIRAFSESHTVSETIIYTLEHSGIATALGGANEEDRERLENTKELVSLAATRYDTLEEDGVFRLLEDAALATDQDEMDQRTEQTKVGVTLMTVHAAKGLEFSEVFVTGLEDTLFPHERAGVSEARADDEEERRLYYVALTRAKHKLYLSYAHVRTVFGQRTPRTPSQFILDINEKYLASDTVTESRGKVIYLD